VGFVSAYLHVEGVQECLTHLINQLGCTSISSEVASNPDYGTWKTLFPQLQQNMKDWFTNNTNVIYWAFFVIDDESKVNLNVGQKMCCIVCHTNGINLSHHS
jgi:hypothetical protein